MAFPIRGDYERLSQQFLFADDISVKGLEDLDSCWHRIKGVAAVAGLVSFPIAMGVGGGVAAQRVSVDAGVPVIAIFGAITIIGAVTYYIYNRKSDHMTTRKQLYQKIEKAPSSHGLEERYCQAAEELSDSYAKDIASLTFDDDEVGDAICDMRWLDRAVDFIRKCSGDARPSKYAQWAFKFWRNY